MTSVLKDSFGAFIVDIADDTDGLAEEEEELANLVERLDKASTAYGMEISAEKTKLMINNTIGINTEIYSARGNGLGGGCLLKPKHLALRPQKPLRLIRDGKVGGSGILYLTSTRYTVTTRMILH